MRPQFAPFWQPDDFTELRLRGLRSARLSFRPRLLSAVRCSPIELGLSTPISTAPVAVSATLPCRCLKIMCLPLLTVEPSEPRPPLVELNTAQIRPSDVTWLPAASHLRRLLPSNAEVATMWTVTPTPLSESVWTSSNQLPLPGTPAIF